MRKYTIFTLSIFLFVSTGYTQTINKEIKKDSPLLREQPFGHFKAEDVLNGKIYWSTPWPIKLTYDDSGFDYSKLGSIPAKGSHPRIFTSPKELENIKKRLQQTHVGKMMLAQANKASDEMRTGKGRWGKIYVALQHSEMQPEQATAMGWQFTNSIGWNFVNQLTVQGLIAQINHDATLLKETATISSRYLRMVAKYIEQLPVVQGLEDMPKEPVYWGGYLAKLYDFTATGMTNGDRSFFTQFIAAQTKGKYSDGMNLPPHWRRWNHIAMSLSYPLSLLSVEKEVTLDSRVYQRGKELAEDYYTYQFSPEGMSTEGMNYTLGQSEYNISFLIAMARRGDKNILTHPHFRAMADWFMQTLSPNPKALWHTGGDTGSISILPWTLIMTMKYFYPNDKRLDYLLANSLPTQLTDTPDIIAFVCCNDPEKTAEQYKGIPDIEMPLTYYSSMRGAFITRNRWDQQAIKFSLEGRSDTYFISHDHSDRGQFSLSAHGREWVVDGFRSTESKYHSVICIDGRGQGYFATPASWLGFSDKADATFGIIDTKYCYDWMWLKSPAADQMLGHKVAEKWSTGVYRNVAEKLKEYYPGEKPERDPLENVVKYYAGNLKGNPLIWHEDTWPMRLKHYPVQYAYRTAGLVKGKHTYALIVDDIKKDDNEHLYEWLMPMPLDVELVSIKQTAMVEMQNNPLNLGFNKISGHRKGGEYDMILGDKRMKRDRRPVDDIPGGFYNSGAFKPSKGDPQLLVRVLDKTPSPRPNLEVNPRLEAMEHLKTEDIHQFYLRSMGLGKRLVIPAQCTGAPNYKVLLFPYLHGEELPQTEWNDDRTELTVKWSDQTDLFTFRMGEDRRTRVTLQRNNKIICDFQ